MLIKIYTNINMENIEELFIVNNLIIKILLFD